MPRFNPITGALPAEAPAPKARKPRKQAPAKAAVNAALAKRASEIPEATLACLITDGRSVAKVRKEFVAYCQHATVNDWREAWRGFSAEQSPEPRTPNIERLTSKEKPSAGSGTPQRQEVTATPAPLAALRQTVKRRIAEGAEPITEIAVSAPFVPRKIIPMPTTIPAAGRFDDKALDAL